MWVAKLAVEYRQRWHNDVVIDMLCYRRRGHNEGDDPSMTQPSMYDIIDAKRSVRKIYTESLIGRGDISVDEAEHALKDFSNQLEHVFNEVRELERTPPTPSPVGGGRAVGPRGPRHLGAARGRPPDRRRAREPARGLHGAPAGEAGAGEAVQDVARGRRRLGLRRAARARVAGGAGQADPPVRAGLPPRHVRAAPLGDHRPAAPARSTSRCATCRPSRSGSCPTTRRSRSSPRSGSSTATPSPTRTRWCCGRRSSATSSTAPSRSSTSSSPPVRPSGGSAATSPCCSRTASRARGRTTPPAASSGSCSCAPRAR